MLKVLLVNMENILLAGIASPSLEQIRVNCLSHLWFCLGFTAPSFKVAEHAPGGLNTT